MVSLHRTLTKKDNKYQLKIYSRVEAGFCFSFPFSVREFCLVWNYGDLVHIVSVCVLLSSAVSGKHYFLGVLHHLWFLFPLPYITLSLEGRDLIKAYHHVGLNTPKSLSLHIVLLWISVEFPSTKRRNFSDDTDLSYALPHGDSSMSLCHAMFL